MRALHRREADEIERRFPKVLRRVGGYNIDSIDDSRPQHGAAARRLRGHARLLQRDRARIAADPGAPGARHLPFPELLRRDGGDPADRRARAERGRTGRPHDDRPVARHPDVPPGRRAVRAGRAGGAAVDRVRRRRPGGESAAAQGARRIDGRSRLPRRGRRGDRPGLPAGGLGDPRAGPQHHDVDERRREAGLVSRGLRGRSSKTSPTTPSA